MIKLPPYLKKGDTIGLTCPAGYMELDKVQNCIHTLQSWGYEVMVGKTIGSKSKTYFSGTDAERRDEFQAMIDDKNIHAILCGRGGYGVSRIIDQLDFTAFKKNPKWIIGFSDITVFLAHLHAQLKTASIHSPMANAFIDGGDKSIYVQSLQKVLKGTKTNYKAVHHPLNKIGKASGELVGGNLALLAHLCGSKSAYKTKGRLLFIEDIGEYIYNIDRMFLQLKRAGYLKNLAGLIVGGFTDIKDNPRPFGQTIQELIVHHVAEYDYPVCFDFPVSHDKENLALKVGVEHQFSVTKKAVLLQEI
ncbi:MAG: LD-carboxypeptidase [Sphingobacteriia bacterium]|jgi:muramoyltetrapeptide carboxypeptidase